MVNGTEVPIFTNCNYSRSRPTINKYAYNIMPYNKYYEKKKQKDDVGKVVVGRMAVRTILDRKEREEISIKMTFEKRPKKITNLDMHIMGVSQ